MVLAFQVLESCRTVFVQQRAKPAKKASELDGAGDSVQVLESCCERQRVEPGLEEKNRV